MATRLILFFFFLLLHIDIVRAIEDHNFIDLGNGQLLVTERSDTSHYHYAIKIVNSRNGFERVLWDSQIAKASTKGFPTFGLCGIQAAIVSGQSLSLIVKEYHEGRFFQFQLDKDKPLVREVELLLFFLDLSGEDDRARSNTMLVDVRFQGLNSFKRVPTTRGEGIPEKNFLIDDDGKVTVDGRPYSEVFDPLYLLQSSRKMNVGRESNRKPVPGNENTASQSAHLESRRADQAGRQEMGDSPASTVLSSQAPFRRSIKIVFTIGTLFILIAILWHLLWRRQG